MNTNPYASPQSAVAEFNDSQPENQGRILLSGTLSVADVVHAQRLATRPLSVRLTLLCLLIAGLLAVLLLVDSPAGGRSAALFSPGMWIVVCATLLLVSLLSYARRYLVFNRQSRHGLGVFAPSHTVVTPEGFSTASEHAASQLKWSLFRGYRVSNRVIVLYVQVPHQFLILARDKLEDQEQWPQLLSLVQQNLPRR